MAACICYKGAAFMLDSLLLVSSRFVAKDETFSDCIASGHILLLSSCWEADM